MVHKTRDIRLSTDSPTSSDPEVIIFEQSMKESSSTSISDMSVKYRKKRPHPEPSETISRPNGVIRPLPRVLGTTYRKKESINHKTNRRTVTDTRCQILSGIKTNAAERIRFSQKLKSQTRTKPLDDVLTNFKNPLMDLEDYRALVGSFLDKPEPPAFQQAKFPLAKRRDLRRRITKDPLEDIFQAAKATLQSPPVALPELPNYENLKKQQRDIDQKGAVKKRKWRTRLQPHQEALVKKTLQKTGTIAELPGAGCEHHDIRKLSPGTWMNDEIATFYGVMINIRSNEYEKARSDPISKLGRSTEKFLRAHCFTSFFMTKYDRNGYEGVKRWSKKVDLFAKDIIIFPVNIANAHWTCAAINIRQQRFEFYDSMGHQNKRVLENLKDYIENEHLAKKKMTLDTSKWSFWNHPDIPQQENAFDCGIFVCQFMDCLSRDWGGGDTIFDFDQGNMPYIRRKMIHEVATCTFLPEEWE